MSDLFVSSGSRRSPRSHPSVEYARRCRQKAVPSLVLIAVLLVAGLAGTGCMSEEPASTLVIRPVRVAVAESAGRGTVRMFSGETQAPTDAGLSFRVGGTIDRLRVRVGDAVSAGQLIATLDPTDYQIEVREAEAALLRADAQERNAQAEYRRIRALYAEDRVSLSAFDATRAEAQVAAAGMEAARERVRSARQRLAYTRIVAPESGFVTDERAQRGEYVQPGQPVVELASAGPLEVEAIVAEDVVDALRVGMGATVRLPATSAPPSTAVITEVGVAPRRGEAGYPVVLRFRSAPPMLRLGLAAQVAFEIDAAPDSSAVRVIVPTVAVAEDFEGRYVYVVNPRDTSTLSVAATEDLRPSSTEQRNGVIARRAVQPGGLTSTGLEILHGLSPGDIVVTAGLSQLQDGDVVRLPSDVAAPSEETTEPVRLPSASG